MVGVKSDNFRAFYRFFSGSLTTFLLFGVVVLSSHASSSLADQPQELQKITKRILINRYDLAFELPSVFVRSASPSVAIFFASHPGGGSTPTVNITAEERPWNFNAPLDAQSGGVLTSYRAVGLTDALILDSVLGYRDSALILEILITFNKRSVTNRVLVFSDLNRTYYLTISAPSEQSDYTRQLAEMIKNSLRGPALQKGRLQSSGFVPNKHLASTFIGVLLALLVAAILIRRFNKN